jgi:hypothetical protein
MLTAYLLISKVGIKMFLEIYSNVRSASSEGWRALIGLFIVVLMIALFTLKPTFGRSISKLLSKRKTIGFNKQEVNG